mmetsp:Transcript_11161/g.25439  ORF Transcript_11161/g.25439 Transcript_11161/m.25439 type:complete len:147 (-) Transcript_11161:86-526(-)
MAASTGFFRRNVFRALRPVEIRSWHLVGGAHSSLLRTLANDLLRDAAPELASNLPDHQFAGDRYYWLSRPSLPGNFDAGIATVRRHPCTARLVLAMFEPHREEPVLLYATDRISLDTTGRPSSPGPALEAALQHTSVAFTGARFGL